MEFFTKYKKYIYLLIGIIGLYLFYNFVKTIFKPRFQEYFYSDYVSKDSLNKVLLTYDNQIDHLKDSINDLPKIKSITKYKPIYINVNHLKNDEEKIRNFVDTSGIKNDGPFWEEFFSRKRYY